MSQYWRCYSDEIPLFRYKRALVLLYWQIGQSWPIALSVKKKVLNVSRRGHTYILFRKHCAFSHGNSSSIVVKKTHNNMERCQWNFGSWEPIDYRRIKIRANSKGDLLVDNGLFSACCNYYLIWILGSWPPYTDCFNCTDACTLTAIRIKTYLYFATLFLLPCLV